MVTGKRNYVLLSIFDFLYLFAWSSTMAFFVIWTTQHLGISATQTGWLYAINAFIALTMQPFFGFISDKFGTKKIADFFNYCFAAAGRAVLYLYLCAPPRQLLLVGRDSGRHLSWGYF